MKRYFCTFLLVVSVVSNLYADDETFEIVPVENATTQINWYPDDLESEKAPEDISTLVGSYIYKETETEGELYKCKRKWDLAWGICDESVCDEYYVITNGSKSPRIGFDKYVLCDGSSWNILEEKDDCCNKDGTEDSCKRYDLVGDYIHVYISKDGVYKRICNGASATVDGGVSSTAGGEVVGGETVVVGATVNGASATAGGEVVEAETGVVGASVVVDVPRWYKIVNKLKQYDLLKRSAWVNKDGKFNTTRLLVDTGAGAVLGTVGGVIANKVIRKNQISSGMDGYQCVVNGQTVAEYGDDFVIDIYR